MTITTNSTWDPAAADGNTLTGGNLSASVLVANAHVRSVHSVSNGKYYFELTSAGIVTDDVLRIGVIDPTLTGQIGGYGGNSWALNPATGVMFVDGYDVGTPSGYAGEGYATAFTIGIFFDVDAGTVGVIGDDGTVYTDAYTIGLPALALVGESGTGTTDGGTINFGASAFTHTVPSGYEAGWGISDVWTESNLGSSVMTGPSLTMRGYGGATGQVTGPSLTALGYGGATARPTGPSLTMRGYSGATARLTGPSLRFTGTGHNSTGEYSAQLTLPMGTLQAWAGANAALTGPSLAIAATGTGTNLGTADLVGPSLTMSGTGVVGGVGSAELTLEGTYSLIGYGGAVCSVTIGALTMTATGTTGGVGSAAMTLPMFELVATGTRQNSGSAELIGPMLQPTPSGVAMLIGPMGRLVAIGTATVTATYEAYAVNLKHTRENPVDEVTRYTNFPFTHIVRYQNSYFGANSTGLYLLEGTTDYAATPTEIPWAFKTAVTDFGYPEFKTIESAYIGGRLGAAETLTLYAGEGDETQAYSYTTPRGELAQNYRQKFGKGIKNHRYYALGANGSGELVIDSIDFNVAKRTRRI